MSNILELNDKLFKMLNDLESGTADPKMAQAVVNVSNAIHNNIKLTLQVAKMTGNQKVGNLLLGTPENEDPDDQKEIESRAVAIRKEEFRQRLAKAKELGYESVEQATRKMGKQNFEKALAQ